MELVEGESLAERLAKGRLPVNLVLRYGIEAAGAVAAAHARGIVHRDLKPANIMITESGIKVLDFGLAKFENADAPHATRTGTNALVGTAAYMSPEQAESKPADARSDIFSLGAVLYEMVTGRHPFRRESPIATLAAIVRDEPVPVLEAAPGTPAGLAHAIERCLRKDPARRYQTAADLRAELEDLSSALSTGTAPSKPRRRRWFLWASVTALAAIAGVAAWLLIPPSPPVARLRQITTDSEPKLWPVVSDGSRLYYLSQSGSGETYLMGAPVSGGPSTPMPFALPGSRAALEDISPDGQELLLRADNLKEYPWGNASADLWAVRISDGSSRRTGAVPAADVRYSPDGSRIAWSTYGDKLYVGPSEGSGAREIVTMPGWTIAVRAWPAPGRIEFYGQRPKSAQYFGWQVAPDGTGLRRMLPEWNQSHSVSGVSPDGRFQIALSAGGLWSYPIGRVPFPKGTGTPVPITSSPPNLLVPYQSRAGRMFALGIVRLGELQRFESKTGSWQRHMGGISADHVEYSPDGRLVVYVRYPDGVLWRCRAAGNECLQLTDKKRLTFALYPHWSPDGGTIAFTAVETNRSEQRIWLVDADGGNLRPAAPGYAGQHGDAAWSADGKRLILGADGPAVVRGEPHSLHVVDLESGQVTGMPGTDWLWSPKSSPDGSRLLALRTELPRELRTITIYDNSSGRWRSTGEYANYPQWAADGKSITYSTMKEFRRFRLDTWKAETIAPIDRLSEVSGFNGAWVGQDPFGALLIMRNRSITQVYEVEFPTR